MPSAILPTVVIVFVVYFFFINNLNRRRYMPVFKFCKWYIPVMSGSATSQPPDSGFFGLIDMMNKVISYAKENGYTFEGGDTSEYNFNNIRDPNGKKIINTIINNNPGDFMPALIDTEGEPMYLVGGPQVVIKGGTAGDIKYEYQLKGKSDKKIATLYLIVKGVKLPDYWDYSTNTLIKEIDEYSWAIKGPIPYDWQDIKRQVSKIFKE